MDERILIKYATRSRKDNFFRGLDSIKNNLAKPGRCWILVTMDVDDPEMRSQEVVERLREYTNTSYYYGISHSKTDAINRDMPLAPPFEILVNFSDDMEIIQYGFDAIIRDDMEYVCGDLDMFLHYSDPFVKDKIPTLSVMGKTYYERTNRIYHPDFISVCSDNYAMLESQKLGKYKFINKQIYIHRHPRWDLAPMDELYFKNEHPNMYKKDKETLNRLILELK